MAFYLRPPSGNISLEKLESFAWRRLCFLIKILETHNNNNIVLTNLVYEDVSLVSDSDCLIEGTKKDQISHFILRMAFSEHDDMWEWFENAETLLYNFRFLCMNPDEIFQCLKSVWRTVGSSVWNTDSNLFSLKGALKVLQEIPSTFDDWLDVIDKYFSGRDNEYFIVPFLYALELVSERKVMLERGRALVPFNKLHVVMTSIFQNILHFSRPQFQEIQIKLDERITKLFHHLQSHLKLNVLKIQFCNEVSFGYLNHEAVDNEVQFFPPCMVYYHKQLRLKHRLKHQSRINYTLFLKEAGLSIHESLMFWKNEYSQKCKDHKETKCLHSWNKDAKRYIYNIRHLYGLEGCRINYRAHTCASLQSGGGCPFVDFDEAHLQNLLCDEKIASNHENIMALVQQKKPSNACTIFFWEKLKKFTPFNQKLFCRNIEHHSSNMECENVQITVKCSAAVDKDIVSSFEDKSEIRNLNFCGSYEKLSAVGHFEDNDLHTEETNPWQKCLEEISKKSFLKQNERSESVFKSSVIPLLSEKSSLSSELHHKNSGSLNFVREVNSNIHSTFSDLSFLLQLQLSTLHQDLNCIDDKVVKKPIQFYKNFKKFIS